MATIARILPEDVLIATFYCVGGDVRLTDDQRLSDIFNDAAKSSKDSPFAPFKSHPLYGYSRKLSEALQSLDHAGSIVRENAAQLYFQATDHTSGPFGKTVFDSFDGQQQAAIEAVALKIRQTFGAGNEPRTSGAHGTRVAG